jgi:chaperone LolA
VGAAVAQKNPVNLSTLLDALQRKYSRMSGIAADFTQIYVGADGRSRRESGRLALTKTRKARWDYESPERKVFVSDGRNVYFHVYGEPEATVASIKESADPQIPFLFLLGRSDLRNQFTRIELAANEQPISAGNVILRLFPKRAPQEFKQLLVEVNPNSIAVARVVIVETNNARMDFHLTNVREGYTAPDGFFKFTPLPGVVLRRAN